MRRASVFSVSWRVLVYVLYCACRASCWAWLWLLSLREVEPSSWARWRSAVSSSLRSSSPVTDFLKPSISVSREITW